MDYKEWLDYQSRLQKRDVSQDEEDYDLPSYVKSLKFNPGEAGKFDPNASSAHLEDTYKKPNHPTFSDQSMYNVPGIQEGGHWTEDGEFTPSEHNLNNMSPDQMTDYFKKADPTAKLNLPENKRFSRIRKLFGKK